MMAMTGEVPVPDSESVCGLAGALSTNEMVADFAVAELGVNVRLSVAVPPAATVIGSAGLPKENSAAFGPDLVKLEITRLVVPGFEMVTGMAALVVL